MCMYIYAKYYIIYREYLFIYNIKYWLQFFSLAYVTLVHKSGIYTEVFSSHSTQFSEAKTTHMPKQFVEHQ